jgi:hypothetical protein
LNINFLKSTETSLLKSGNDGDSGMKKVNLLYEYEKLCEQERILVKKVVNVKTIGVLNAIVHKTLRFQTVP